MKTASFVQDGNRFAIRTGTMEKEVALNDAGQFCMVSLHAADGREMVGGRVPSDEFAAIIDGVRYEGLSGGWTVARTDTNEWKQGELEAIITLQRDEVEVERHYLAYPGQPVIGEWTVWRNLASHPVRFDRPSIFIGRLLDGGDVDFSYMTGGANFTGSLMYKTNRLTDGYHRAFDSHGEPEMAEVEGSMVNEQHPVPNGSGIWCEFYTMQDCASNEGVFVTFDYQGWWKSDMIRSDGVTALRVWCALADYEVGAGETLTTPNVSAGVWQGDLDDLGNTLADYSYTYKWDATHPRYFLEPSSTIWREAPLTEKVFRMIEYSRYIGVEQIHVDDFWFDAKGNWNAIFGDDWREANVYMHRNGMDFRLWMPPWHADRLSQVWLDHPDWMLNFHGNWYNWTIDLSREEAYQWILQMLCDKQKEFGTYMLRVDGNPTCLKNDGSFTTSGGNYNGAHKQSENFYRLYREFKEKNPDAGLNGCSSGGHTLSIESIRYTDTQQITDGCCRHYGSYYAPLFAPIDKVVPYSFNVLMQNPLTEPYTEQQLEDMRLRCERVKWARNAGVIGRYSKVYRPEVQQGDKTFFLQRMTGDGVRGMLLLLGGANPGLGKPERVYPKGLCPEQDYTVDSLLGTVARQTQSGAEWMCEGIAISKLTAGEEIYFNLHDRPGLGSDTEPPTTPASIRTQPERWMGHEGLGVEWAASTDNVMVSYYELYKNGALLSKISVGTYYFDTEGDSEAQYAVCAVDCDGNKSDFAYTAR